MTCATLSVTINAIWDHILRCRNKGTLMTTPHPSASPSPSLFASSSYQFQCFIMNAFVHVTNGDLAYILPFCMNGTGQNQQQKSCTSFNYGWKYLSTGRRVVHICTQCRILFHQIRARDDLVKLDTMRLLFRYLYIS